jgi:hypothetical protein
MPERPEQARSLTNNFSETTQTHYSVYFHQMDAWTLAALHHSEFYQDFLKSHGMEWIVTTTMVNGRADSTTPVTQVNVQASEGDRNRARARNCPAATLQYNYGKGWRSLSVLGVQITSV